jgi:hypothetical protein
VLLPIIALPPINGSYRSTTLPTGDQQKASAPGINHVLNALIVTRCREIALPIIAVSEIISLLKNADTEGEVEWMNQPQFVCAAAGKLGPSSPVFQVVMRRNATLMTYSVLPRLGGFPL